MISPLLSILIPTKNREEYAYNVIEHILSLNDDRIQLVVYNNSDTNKLEHSISQYLTDKRLNYFYNSELLSFVDNFSNGIEKCHGEYITIIGDDDSINPHVVDITEWAKNNNIEAITPSLQLIYYWPGSGVNSEDGTGKLTISEITSEVKFYNPRNELKKLLNNGCQNYLNFKLAKAYHGVIKKSVLEEIKNRTGKYIGGLSPDIYLSVAASSILKKILVIDYPLTLSGICGKSGSADSATGRHTGKLENAPHFKGHDNYSWSSKVPSFYSVEAIWADSALAALRDLKQNELISYFNIDAISAFCINLYPQFKKEIVQNMIDNYNIAEDSILIKYHILKGKLFGPSLTWAKAVFNHVFYKKSFKSFNNIPDLKSANILIEKEISNQNELIFKNLKKLDL